MRNDLPVLLADLEAGKRVAMLIAPAAWRVFSGETPARGTAAPLAAVLGVLRALGVRAFVPVLPYADLTVWAYYRLFAQDPGAAIVSSICAGCAGMADGMAPLPGPRVYSPLLCAARCLKTYETIPGGLAFLSPCAHKHREFAPSGAPLVTYHIPISSLAEWLDARPGLLARAAPVTLDPGGGLTVAAFGSLSAALARVLPALTHAVVQGAPQARAFLASHFPGLPHPCFFEPYACPGGCAQGAAIGRRVIRPAPPPPGPGVSREALLARFRRYDEIYRLEDFLWPPCQAGGPAR